MSRRERERERENRDSQSTRLHSSRSNREPSPKKTRRDVKQGTERAYYNSSHLDTDAHKDRYRSDRRRLQDSLPLDVPPETKKHSERLKEGTERKNDLHTQVPRTQSFFQHDERSSAGHRGQSYSSRLTVQGSWNDSKRDKVEEKKAWRHDGYYELEKNAAAPPPRKRPAFREKKIEAPPETVEPAKSIYDQREGRLHYSREDKSDRAFSRGDDRNIKRGEGYQSMDRRGVNRNNGNQPQVEKWKHDLFEDANTSTSSRNEEEEIAKIEALLAL